MSRPVTLHVWRVSPRHLPAVALEVASGGAGLRRAGAGFAALLGTGSGTTFAPRDVTPLRWVQVAVWPDDATADRHERSAAAARWRHRATESARLVLRPLASRGRWQGRAPFEVDEGNPAGSSAWDGRVLALTHARLRRGRARRFRRAVPAVAQELRGAAGLRVALAMGEFPVGRQGTLSLWDSVGAMRAFAHRGAAHAAVVRATPREDWYAEELFAHFAVVDAAGTVDGVPVG